MVAGKESFDLKGKLIDKSLDAYALALETINRITIRYRLETFCYLICNAWELLLKAKILEDADTDEAIYYKEQQGRTRRSLALRDCLKRVIPDERDAMRRNVELVEELRDEAVHLVIGYIPHDIVGLFQANVVNYHKKLHEWFGRSLSDKAEVGMMSIVYDLSPELHDLTNSRLQSNLGPEAFDFLTGYCAGLKQEFDELQRPAEFSVAINYHLLVTKSSDQADIRLSSGQTDGPATQIVEIPRDPSISHPFRQKDAIEQVNTLLPGVQINQHDIRCINKIYDVQDKRIDYFYQGKVKGSPGQYSQGFVDWIVEQYRRDDQFFNKTRARAKEGSGTDKGR